MAPIGLSQMIVPASQHTLFMRGFAGAMDKEDIREFFTNEGGKCSFDFIKLTDDRRYLYVALRFESKEVAREMMTKYNDTEVLGSRVSITWYKDLRKARIKALEAMRERRMHFRKDQSPDRNMSPTKKRHRLQKKSASYIEGSEEGEIRNSGSRSISSISRRSSSLGSVIPVGHANIDGGAGGIQHRSVSPLDNGFDAKRRSISKGSISSAKMSSPRRFHEEDVRHSRSASIRRKSPERKHKKKGKRRRRMRSTSLYSGGGGDLDGPASPELGFDHGGTSKDPDPNSLSLGAAIKMNNVANGTGPQVNNTEDLEAYEEEDVENAPSAALLDGGQSKSTAVRHVTSPIDRNARKSLSGSPRRSFSRNNKRSLSRKSRSPPDNGEYRQRRDDSKENQRPRRGGRPSGRNFFRRSPFFRRGPRSPRFKGPMDDEARERLIKDRAARNRQKYIQQQMGRQYEEYLKKEQDEHQKLIEANEKALFKDHVSTAITYKRGGSEIYGFGDEENGGQDDAAPFDGSHRRRSRGGGVRRGGGGGGRHGGGHRRDRRYPRSPSRSNEGSSLMENKNAPSPSNAEVVDMNATKLGSLFKKNKAIEDMSKNKPLDPSQFFKNTMTDVAKDSAGNASLAAQTGYPLGVTGYNNGPPVVQQNTASNNVGATLDAATIKNIKDYAPPGSDPDQFLASVLGEDAPNAAITAAFQHHFQMLANNTPNAGTLPPLPILTNNQPAPPSKININLKMFASNMAAAAASATANSTANTTVPSTQFGTSITAESKAFETNLKESYAQFMDDVASSQKQVENDLVTQFQDKRIKKKKKGTENEDQAFNLNGQQQNEIDEFYEEDDDWRHMGDVVQVPKKTAPVAAKKTTRGQRLNEELKARLQDLEGNVVVGKRKKRVEISEDEEDEIEELVAAPTIKRNRQNSGGEFSSPSATTTFKFKTLGVLESFKKQIEMAYQQDCSVLYGVSKLLMIDENLKSSIRKSADENIKNLANTCITQMREIFQRVHHETFED